MSPEAIALAKHQVLLRFRDFDREFIELVAAVLWYPGDDRWGVLPEGSLLVLERAATSSIAPRSDAATAKPRRDSQMFACSRLAR
jgi:hypothetical protein